MPDFFEFEVEFAEIRPRIWRRFLLRSSGTFYDLHLAIQACGWFGGHLWAFMDDEGDRLAGIPDDEFGDPDPDARKVNLSSFFSPRGGRRCLYVYDFGDNWEHEITLEQVVRRKGDDARILLGGERRFPPEDCGGIWGYYGFLEAIQNPDHPEHNEMLEWIGDSFDPEEFDLEEINPALSRVK